MSGHRIAARPVSKGTYNVIMAAMTSLFVSVVVSAVVAWWMA